MLGDGGSVFSEDSDWKVRARSLMGSTQGGGGSQLPCLIATPPPSLLGWL